MTHVQGWAEKKVDGIARWQGGLRDDVVDLLKAEHARSVRIVKRFIKRYAAERDLLERQVAENILAALTKGRTGRKGA